MIICRLLWWVNEDVSFKGKRRESKPPRTISFRLFLGTWVITRWGPLLVFCLCPVPNKSSIKCSTHFVHLEKHSIVECHTISVSVLTVPCPYVCTSVHAPAPFHGETVKRHALLWLHNIPKQPPPPLSVPLFAFFAVYSVRCQALNWLVTSLEASFVWTQLLLSTIPSPHGPWATTWCGNCCLCLACLLAEVINSFVSNIVLCDVSVLIRNRDE